MDILFERLNVDPQHIPDIEGRHKAYVEYDLIDLSSLDLINLQEETFVGYEHVKHINLSDNQLEGIPKIFGSLNNLLTLDLSFSISPAHLGPDEQLSLPEGIFDDLENLKIIDMRENHIEILPDSIFSNLFKLEVMNLSYNLLARLPNSIGNCVNLEELYLTGNLLPTECAETYADYNDLQDFLVPYRNIWQNINPEENALGEFEYGDQE